MRYRVEGAGPLLIYIPGLDGTGELFYKQAPALMRRHRVVTYRSREQGRFTYDDLADDLAALIGELGEPRATMVGESFGGTVALQFVLRHPAMTERLVVVNSFARFRGRVRIALAARLVALMPWRMTWLARLLANTLGLMREGIGRDDRRRFLAAVRTVDKEGYARRLRLIAELNLDDRLREMRTPTLLIAGDRDWLVPSVREARAMAARLPQAELRILAGAGHASLLSSRVCLADILAEWLRVKTVPA